MAVCILTVIFCAITMLSNLLSRFIFTVAANLLVLTIQAFKVPGEALQLAMEKTGDLIRVCVEYFLEILIEVISGVVGYVFDVVKDGVFGSVAVAGAVAIDAAEKMRSSFDWLLEEISATVEGVVEMVSTLVVDLWNNYMEAKSYVVENA